MDFEKTPQNQEEKNKEEENKLSDEEKGKDKSEEGKPFTEEELKRMGYSAEKQELRERKRSGGVDPNED